MSMILRPVKWFYHEFGIVSIHETGRNAWLIILARSCRMFAYGTNSLILAIFFSALNYSDHQIGIFMTLTLLGDVFLGTFLTLIADRVGRRRVLMAGSVLMIMSGAAFAIFERFWILLGAAILGVISVTGGDFGPFRSIEESVLSQLTTPTTRADVLAWYVTTSTLGSSIGSEASGRFIRFLQDRPGWTEVDAYHSLFWVYSAMGVVNVLLVLPLSDACELKQPEEMYERVPQNETADHHRSSGELPTNDLEAASPPPTPRLPPTPNPTWTARTKALLSHSLSQISGPTLSVMYKLWFLLAVDSLADGMVPYSLTNYYMDIKFHPSKSTLGDVTSISYALGAVGAVFAGPLARKIGLINTMVFTHVPSSAAVLVFAWPPVFWITAFLLFVRTGLNNMDQAPRSAFIAAVVRPDERTAVMGITAMLRNLAAMAGPTVTGVLAENDQFGVAFIAAGVFRLAYDFGLYAMFVNMKLYQHEPKPAEVDSSELELESLADTASQSESDSDLDRDKDRDRDRPGLTTKEPPNTTNTTTANNALQVPLGLERVRSRSPRRSTALD